MKENNEISRTLDFMVSLVSNTTDDKEPDATIFDSDIQSNEVATNEQNNGHIISLFVM